MALVLYPKVPRKALDFSKVKSVTVPDQSMSLAEIIRRFVRKESLPVLKEGVYEDRFGDLEKLANEDIVVQLDRAAEISDWLRKAEERQKRLDKEKADAAAAAAKVLADRQAKLDALLDSKVTEPVK